MKRERRSFDKEFKMMAVNLCLTGKPTKLVAEELGIRLNWSDVGGENTNNTKQAVFQVMAMRI